MRQVLQDADWLEAIGEVGLVRCAEYNKAHYPNEDTVAMVCKHIHEKLLLIPAELNFKCSRDIAVDLVEPMMQYLRDNELH
jgi:HD superfamily phosphodiesterase